VRSVSSVIARRYQDLECWQLADRLKKRVYALIATEPACLEYARASLMETQNHLGDALDCGYATASEQAELFALADRAIGEPRTRNSEPTRTPNPKPGTEP